MKNGTLTARMRRQIEHQGRTLVRRRMFADLGGYDQVGRALLRLEAEGVIERIGRNLWRRVPGIVPRLTANRTWSRPSGVEPNVAIASALVSPRFDDLLSLSLTLGVPRLRRILADLRPDDIRDEIRASSAVMLDRIAEGFADVAAELS